MQRIRDVSPLKKKPWLLAGPLLILPSSAWAFELRITMFELWLVGMSVALPGVLLALWWLWRWPGPVVARGLLTAIWLIAMPFLALAAVSLITPGILGRMHAYGLWEQAWRIWLIGSLAVFLPALPIRRWRRQ